MFTTVLCRWVDMWEDDKLEWAGAEDTILWEAHLKDPNGHDIYYCEKCGYTGPLGTFGRGIGEE